MSKGFVFFILSVIIQFVFACKQSDTKGLTNLSLSETTEIITYLASDELDGRYPGQPGYDLAADYVINKLKQANIQPFGNAYKHWGVFGNHESYNIVAINQQFNKHEKTILISAHLDHIPTISHLKDTIHNGANDNASGVAAVLQIAKYVSRFQHNENILFAFFTAEESGLLGAKQFAKKLQKQEIQPSLHINIDMIGSRFKNNQGQVFITGYKKSNLAKALNKQANKNFVKFFPKEQSLYLFKRSDNFPIFEQFNIPAHTISSYDFETYPYYHHVNDEVEQLDLENTHVIIENMATALQGILDNDVPISLTSTE